jgi:hypothetical protein
LTDQDSADALVVRPFGVHDDRLAGQSWRRKYPRPDGDHHQGDDHGEQGASGGENEKGSWHQTNSIL